jgi:hypothetical protein
VSINPADFLDGAKEYAARNKHAADMQYQMKVLRKIAGGLGIDVGFSSQKLADLEGTDLDLVAELKDEPASGFPDEIFIVSRDIKKLIDLVTSKDGKEHPLWRLFTAKLKTSDLDAIAVIFKHGGKNWVIHNQTLLNPVPGVFKILMPSSGPAFGDVQVVKLEHYLKERKLS